VRLEGRRGRPRRASTRHPHRRGPQAALRALAAEYRALEKSIDARFHPYWGSLFKQDVELSSFGDQVEEYACLYTARVSNLLHYSPLQFFRSPRDLMPHELV
jgi:5'-nucleotidase